MSPTGRIAQTFLFVCLFVCFFFKSRLALSVPYSLGLTFHSSNGWANTQVIKHFLFSSSSSSVFPLFSFSFYKRCSNVIGKHIHLYVSKVEHIWGGEYKRSGAGRSGAAVAANARALSSLAHAHWL